MKTNGALTYQEEKALLMYLTEIYCKAKTLMELYEDAGADAHNTAKYVQQEVLVNLIDRTLNNCSPEARFIIIHTYIRKDGNDWYIPYYSDSTFYRLKKNAVHEFTSCIQKLRD
jgi:hypothetical protein